MGLVTEIKINKKADRAKLYIDDDVYGYISMDVIYRYNIAKGSIIDVEEMEVYAFESDKVLACNYAINYITNYESTERKLRNKLKEKTYSPLIIEHAIGKCKEYGYIDDYKYAERYIERKSCNSGSYKIKSELLALGIENSIIEELLSEVDSDEILEGAIKQAERWASTRDMDDKSNRDKLIRYMQSRGYSWNVIGKCITALKAEEEEMYD